jgi:hypothetical protein
MEQSLGKRRSKLSGDEGEDVAGHWRDGQARLVQEQRLQSACLEGIKNSNSCKRTVPNVQNASSNFPYATRFRNCPMLGGPDAAPCTLFEIFAR